MKNITLIASLILALLIQSCSDSSELTGTINQHDISTRTGLVIRGIALKGPFDVDTRITHTIMKDGYDSVITVLDDMSSTYTTEFVVEDTISGAALMKTYAPGSYLIKTTVNGDNLNEFTNEWENVKLRGYTIVTGEDTANINITILSHLIATVLDTFEPTVENYECARLAVMNDLGLDTNFNVNQTWTVDSLNTSESAAGIILALSNLVLMGKDNGLVPERYNNLMYDGANNDSLTFKYWATGMFLVNSKYYESMEELESRCDSAYKFIEEAKINYNNITSYSISKETSQECKEYVNTLFGKNLGFSWKSADSLAQVVADTSEYYWWAGFNFSDQCRSSSYPAGCEYVTRTMAEIRVVQKWYDPDSDLIFEDFREETLNRLDSLKNLIKTAVDE